MTDTDLQDILQNGIRFHKMGDLEKAESYYQQILAQEPAAPNTLHYLSLLKGQQKDFSASADYAQKAIQFAPENAHFYYTLGNAQQKQGKLDEAISSYQKALTLRSEYMEAAYQLGETLMLKEQWEEAITAFKQALALNPQLAEAYLGIGVARNAQKDYEKAIHALTECVALSPDAALAHFELAKAYAARRLFRPAKASLEKVLAHDESNRECLIKLAEACFETRDFNEAIRLINKVIALGPDESDPEGIVNYANSYANLGIYLQITGDFDAAEQAFLKALSLNDEQASAYRGLEEMDRFPPDLNVLEKINTMLQQPERFEKSQLAFLHLTKSRLLEKQKKDDEAFEHLHISKQLKKETGSWSIEPTYKAFEDLMSFFTPSFIKKFEGVGHTSTAPIFVVSMPRAGSTLTEQILASHSQVFGAGELGGITDAVSNLVGVNNLDFPYVLSSLTPEQFDKIGADYVRLMGSLCPPEFKNFKHFTDKLPANFRLIGFIHLILPNAKIVHCVRHPIDTCLGCYKQIFRDENLEFSNDLGDTARYYRIYHQLMNHWKKLFPNKILDVYYEQMVADQEAQSRRLLDFCGLPWEDQVLEYHKTERPVFTASNIQVRQPIYNSALGRWKRYEKHLGPLFEILGPIATDYPY